MRFIAKVRQDIQVIQQRRVLNRVIEWKDFVLLQHRLDVCCCQSQLMTHLVKLIIFNDSGFERINVSVSLPS